MNLSTKLKKGRALLWPPKLIAILLSGNEGNAAPTEPAQKKAKKAGVPVTMQVVAGGQS